MDPGVLSSPPSSCTTTNSSRLNLLSVCLGWIHCCTPLPPLSLWTSSTSLLSHQSFCTTSISDRLDSSLVCLGWIRCCTPLPPLSPLCAHGPQVYHCCHPTHSAQPPSRVDLTRRQSISVGFVVVSLYPLHVDSNTLLLSPILFYHLQYFSIITTCHCWSPRTLPATHIFISVLTARHCQLPCALHTAHLFYFYLFGT